MAQNVSIAMGSAMRGCATAIQFGQSRRRSAFQPCSGLFFAPLPDDPTGFANVTFSGVVAGSEIRVYDPDLNELAGIESCAADQVLSWSVYAPGSPYNTVQVKVVALGYKIKDFPYTSQVGNQSIPVQMEIDPWYRNPA